MTTRVFCRYDLRTTDPHAARGFYSDVLGLDLPEGIATEGSSPLAVWPLHEQARARGAPAHWLGGIGVPNVEEAVRRLVELGSERLGPTVRAKDGTAFATLRDPGGAVMAVRASTERPRVPAIAWHQLHTLDLDRAWTAYSELFGWTQTGTLDVPGLDSGHRLFAWDASGNAVGAMSNTARSPGIHAHWLYFFPVTDLDGRLEDVRSKGGRVVTDPVTLPNGKRLSPCQDPQGAAFGLMSRARDDAVPNP